MVDNNFFQNLVESARSELNGGILSAGYMDLNTRQSFSSEGGRVFPAASIVKVPILLEYLRRAADGTLNPDETLTVTDKDIVGGAGILMEMHRGLTVTLKDLAHLMIVISDNTASNMLLDYLGMEKVNEFMQSSGMKNSVIGRKFMIDPNAKFSKNFVTVDDMLTLYEKLYHNTILTPDACSEAIAILSRQQYREKIPLLLPSHLKVAHKTGEITGVRHDCAIVLYDPAPYILCLLTEKLPDVVTGDRTLATLSKKILDKIMEKE